MSKSEDDKSEFKRETMEFLSLQDRIMIKELTRVLTGIKADTLYDTVTGVVSTVIFCVPTGEKNEHGHNVTRSTTAREQLAGKLKKMMKHTLPELAGVYGSLLYGMFGLINWEVVADRVLLHAVKVICSKIRVRCDSDSTPEGMGYDDEFLKENPDFVKSFYRQQWYYVGVDVAVKIEVYGQEKIVESGAVWGIESNAVDTQFDYAKSELLELKHWFGGIDFPEPENLTDIKQRLKMGFS